MKKPTISRLGAYLALFVVIILGFSIMRNIGKVAAIRDEVEKEKMAVAKLKRENDDLAKKVESIQGVEFMEAQLRNKLGLAKPGETVVILPDRETLIKLAPRTDLEEETLPDPNWKKWIKLFI